MAERSAAGGSPLTLQFIQGVDNIAQEVESVGDLNRSLSSQAHSLSDAVAAVTRDDLGAGVLVQPTRERGGLIVWQHVDRSSDGEINQQQAVSQRSPVQRELVDTQLAWRSIQDELLTAEQAAQSVRAGRHASGASEPRTGFASGTLSDSYQQSRYVVGPTAVARQESSEPLSEDLALATRLITEKAPSPYT